MGLTAMLKRSLVVTLAVVGVAAAALLQCTPAAPVANSSGPLIVNGDFEEAAGGLPAGWTRDSKSDAKGEVAIVSDNATSGRNALRLRPNAKNVDSEKFSTPLSLGQGWEAGKVAGKTLYVSGMLLARGGATAVIGLYAHRTDGTVDGVRLTQASDKGAMIEQSGRLVIPDDGKTRFVVLVCAVEGQSGEAYFDDIRLSTTPPAPAARGAADGRGPELTAEVGIDAARIGRAIPRTLYGTNLEWIWDGDGVWAAAQGGLDRNVVRLAQDLGVTSLRFPGGILADFYRWNKAIGPQSGRPTTAHMPGAGESRHTFGTDEALQLSRELQAPLLITVNVATGDAAEAAGWVRYVAGESAKDPRIPRVRLWEIGNENYNRGPAAYLERSTLTPENYARRFLEFAAAMRKADPGIQLMAISDAMPGTRAPHGYPDWTRKVLQAAGRDIDYLSVHNAYAPTLATDRGEDTRSVYAAMLAAPQLIRRSLDEVQAQIRASVPDSADRIKIAVTEWGPAFQISPDGRYVDHVKTLGSALFVASALKVFIESPSVEIANFFKLVDPLWSGSIGKRGDTHAATAPYYALQLYTKHFGDVLVQTAVKSPTFASPAVGWVDAVPDVPYLDVVASLARDGKSLHVIGVNKHFDRDIRARITLANFVPRGDAGSWTLNGTGIDANTGTDVFRAPSIKWARQEEDRENPRFSKGAPGEVAVTAGKLAGLAASFEYVFPAHSVTALVLPR
jgi:alpha-N-arabinofuranosidase